MTGLRCDVLVIGAGAAGLRAAVGAAGAGQRALVVDRGEPGQAGASVSAASDWMAYGAAFGHRDPEDSPAQHATDILLKGGLCLRPELARRIAEDAPARLRDIEQYGGAFDRAPDGTYLQVHSDGATYARACGRGADTGPMMVRALLAEARRRGVETRAALQLVDLLLSSDGAVAGALFASADNQLLPVHAKATVLATGGDGALFEFNALPPGMYGAGYAAALRAGARLANMEFIQIGPCISHPVKFALSGVFWRLNRRITNGAGDEFLPSATPQAIDLEAALHIKGHSFPFTVRNDSVYIDVAIFREIVAGRGGPHGGVLMDITPTPRAEIEQRAAVPLGHLLERGLDIRESPFEFAPSVQHCNGGVLIDETAATDLPGLFAAGEAAGGQHGADRPGGNALADSQVFGAIAGESAARWASEQGFTEPAGEIRAPGTAASGRDAAELLRELGRVMWRSCTVVREAAGLSEARARVSALAEEPAAGSLAELLDLRDALQVAGAHLRCAAARAESRGTHFRSDCPNTVDPDWAVVQMVRAAEDGLDLTSEAPQHSAALREAWLASPERRQTPLLPC